MKWSNDKGIVDDGIVMNAIEESWGDILRGLAKIDKEKKQHETTH